MVDGNEKAGALYRAGPSYASADALDNLRKRAGEIRVKDETTGGEKGQKPERFDLLPWDALEEVARVYDYGSRKYADRNWEKGYAWGLSFGALVRHAARWACGQDRDPETGLHHLAHATFHALALISFALRGIGTDNRKLQ